MENLTAILATRGPLAVDPRWLQTHLAATPETMAAELQERRKRAEPPSGGATAVVPLYGFIDQKPGWWAGTSTEEFGRTIDALVNDPQISRIVFDVDSPGGSVYGVEELATKIRAARDKKPIVAVANSLMASAAYWIGSAAGRIVATPGGEVGSIGVIAVHVDQSEALAQAGIKPTIITFGKYKAEGNPWQPLGQEAQAEIQRRVDEYGQMFVSAVSQNRKVAQSEVETGFGEGRVYSSSDAVDKRMADETGTLEELLAGLQCRDKARARNRALALSFRLLTGPNAVS